MPKLSKISFILLLSLGLSAISLAAGNIIYTINESSNEVLVYPNPVTGNEFNIKSEQEITEITVLNILGQQIFSQSFLNIKKVSIELETSDRGVFIVQIKTSDGATFSKRILLK
jgi:hypothetical protein